MVNNPEQATEAPSVTEEGESIVTEKNQKAAETTRRKPRKKAATKKRKATTKKAADIPVVEVGQSPAEIGETLKQAGIEIKDKAKEAGMRPVREFYTSVASQAFSIVHGILDGLDPSKNKKGK